MERLLVPTDFSETAFSAAIYAQKIAAELNSEIILFHSNGNGSAASAGKTRELMHQLSSRAPLIKTTFIESGQPFNPETVRQIVKTNRIGMIIMGTSGVNQEKKPFGSNTLLLMNDSDCPVIAVPRGYPFRPVIRIAYASDLRNFSREIPGVISFARPFNAEIIVLHVTPVFLHPGEVQKIDQAAEIAQVREKQYSYISYHEQKMGLENEITQGIRLFTRQKDIDLLVMFHSSFYKLFATSYTESTMARLQIPIMVFKKPKVP